MIMQKEYDIVIVGSGVAALAFANYILEAKSSFRIAILSKGELPNCNTAIAQGGIAAVTNFEEDSFEEHIEDTFQAGGRVGKIDVIRRVVCDAPARLNDLVRWGVPFNRQQGVFRLHREGGHSKHRIVHYLDQSGKAIHESLLNRLQQHNKIDFFENHTAVDLIRSKNQCAGLLTLDEKENWLQFKANTFVLCGGGSGALFEQTTNSAYSTADCVAMANRIGLNIRDFHKTQFHPTALSLKNQNKLPLISEAVRGFGAHLLNHKGERFAFKCDSRGELAARDVLAAAIFQEMESENVDHQYLSLQHLDQEELKTHFPFIHRTLLSNDFNPTRDLIPIVPVAHYQCGGIEVNAEGRTSIENLFALGECAYTGMHGNNRLASNSLLEAVAYAYYAANTILNSSIINAANLRELKLETTRYSDNGKAMVLMASLQSLMTKMFHHKDDFGFLQTVSTELLKLNSLYEDLNLQSKLAQELRNRLELADIYLESVMKEASKDNLFYA